MGAGFAAGIGAGIAIGIASGRQQGQQQVCEYLEQNQIALFDQEGTRISIAELRQKTKSSATCRINNQAAIWLGVLGLVLLMAIGVIVYFVL